MIGIVVTGHGHFASGLTSSVELIGGKPEHYHAVDFVQEDSTDDLEKKLEVAFASLKDCTDGILVFTIQDCCIIWFKLRYDCGS